MTRRSATKPPSFRIRIAEDLGSLIDAIQEPWRADTELPLLGDPGPPLEWLARSAAVAVDRMGGSSRPVGVEEAAAAARVAYARATARSRLGSPRQCLVATLPGEAAVGAAIYAAARALPLYAADDVNALIKEIARLRPQSVIVAFLTGELSLEELARIRSAASMAPATGSVGWLTARDLATLTWISAKGQVYAASDSSGEAHFIASDGGAESLRCVQQRLHDLISIAGHGDQADAFLGEAYLCGRTETDYDRLLESTRGERLCRCMSERGCYRLPKSQRHRTDLLVSPRRLGAKLVFINSCGALLITGDGFYRPEISIVLSALEGHAAAVITADRPRLAHRDENRLLRTLLARGHSGGEACRRLNAIALTQFGEEPRYELVGDPAMKLPLMPPPELQPNEVHPHRGSILLRFDSMSAPVAVVPLAGPAAALAADPACRAETASPALRAYLDRSTPDQPCLILLNDAPAPAPTWVRLARPPEHGEATAWAGELLRRLALPERHVRLCGEGAADALNATVRGLRRILLSPPATGGSVSAEEAMEAAVHELSLLQGMIASELLGAWSDTDRGELLSLDEADAIFTSRYVDDRCLNCALPIKRRIVLSERDPDRKRSIAVCPRCNLAEDREIADPVLRLETASEVAPPARWPVRLEWMADKALSISTVGATLVGSRGRVAGQQATLLEESGKPAAVTLWLEVRAGLPPGRYYLKVLKITNLCLQYRLVPVSLVSRLDAPVATA